MAENNVNINIIQSGGENSDVVQDILNGSMGEETKTKSKARVFNNARTRRSKFSISISDYFGEKLSEKAYDRVLKKTGDKDKAKMSKFSVAYGINMGAQQARQLVSTSLSNIGTFTSNQAMQNTADNIRMVAGDALSAIGTIGSAAVAGGWVGAAIAAVAVTANKAIEIATASMSISKENMVSDAEAARISDRLGYVETGYSR